MQSLIVALVFSRLDYGSVTLASLLKQLMNRLQSVQNAAAQLIFKPCGQDHIQTLLHKLHWLQMPECISFWLAMLAYHCLHASAPGYLASDLQRVAPQRTSTPAFFDYISAGHSMHCTFYHWRPQISSDCCIGLKQFAGVSPVISVIASFPQQTENRTSRAVLQLRLRTSHCADYYYVTSLFRLIVTCPCSFRT